ncbi:MAG: hypothetical protein ACON4U_13600 [Myxococcota bacterium]
MLVKLSHGASVNPDNLKHITVEQKRIGSKNVFVVEIKMDDNTKHPIAFFDDRDEAIAMVEVCAKNINDAE